MNWLAGEWDYPEPQHLQSIREFSHKVDTPMTMLRSSARTHRTSVEATPPLAFPGQRVGLLGGSFNPPHSGHLQWAKMALRRLALDQLWWMVTPGNPLKSDVELPPLKERLAASRALARHPAIRVTGFEAALGSPYTYATLRFLKRRAPQVRFVLVVGADNFASFHRWAHWREIASLVPIAVVDRPTWSLKALASPAARALAGRRIRESEAALLAGRRPPAWVYLKGRLSQASSTALRAAKQ